MTIFLITLALTLISLIVYIYVKFIKTKKVLNIMNTTSPTITTTSRFHSDDLYIGKTSKLDPTLRTMFPNALFGFPTNPLIVKGFKYFDIDGNQFEEVEFDKIGDKDYILLYDSFENTNYFLNRLMTQATSDVITQDIITLDEAENEYVYEDLSGLIEINVTQTGQTTASNLIRVYAREVTTGENEYLILIQDANVVKFYVGFQISLLQLEEIY